MGLESAVASAVQKGVTDRSIQISSDAACSANVNGSLTCTADDQNTDIGQYSVTINGYNFSGTLDTSNSVGDVSSFPSSISGTFQPSS